MVIDFSDGSRLVAVLLEVLRQREDIGHHGPQGGLQIVNCRRIWTAAAENTRPRRRAYGLLAVGSLEEDALCGQLIDVRRLDEILTIATELRAEVIYGDE